MAKILTTEQLDQAEKLTLEKHSITSLELMEYSSEVCFNWIHNRLQGNPLPIHIICGTGKNGGNGLVIARMLKKHGYNSKTYIVNCDNERSVNFIENYKRLKELGDWPKMITATSEFPEISADDMVIDAILGTGLNRNTDGLIKEVIQFINKVNPYVLAIDYPSGLFPNKPVSDGESVIKANQILTFQTPKLAFLMPENSAYCINWDVLPIGIDMEFVDAQPSNYQLTEKQHILPIYKLREKFSNKGNFGHSLIIGGSFGKMGAVTLAARAALRTGSGLVTAYIPKCGYTIMQIAIPEAMVEIDTTDQLQDFNFKTKPTVIGVGVGMGVTPKTTAGFLKFLKKNKTPLVIDADGLNILSKNIKALKLLPKNTVITPHPKELERLIGKWKDDYHKLELLHAFSKKYALIIVVKGAHSIIVNQGELYFNTTGNPALATAGSGDALTGIITGLIAQGYTPIEASVFGTYLHGSTADLAMQKMVYETFTASEIINYLPNAFLDLFAREAPKEVQESSD